MVCMITNFVLVIVFSLLLCFIPKIGSFDEHTIYKARFDVDLCYFWFAVLLSLFSMAINVFFVSHNALFAIWGTTGVPRDTKDYISIIYATGASDFI